MDPQSASGSGTPQDKADKPGVERFREAAAARAESDVEQEEMLWQGGYSPKDMIGTWLLALIITIGAGVLAFMFVEPAQAALIVAIVAAVIWGGSLLLLLYRRLDRHYELTSQRLIHKEGILKRITNRIEVIDMDDVTFEQGIVQRFLGVGTIHIVSSDRSHPELYLRGIDNVQQVAQVMDDVRRRERRRRGLHIEAI